MKMKVFVTFSDLADSPALQLLRKKYDVETCHHSNPEERGCFQEHIKNASAVLCVSSDIISEKLLDAAGSQLRIVSSVSLGYDKIDIEACKKRGIQVTIASHPLYVSTLAEFTVGLLLATCKRIVEADAYVRNGNWTKLWQKDILAERGIVNSTVGIVGLGKIGYAVLERILAFKPAKVFYYDIYHPVSKGEHLGAQFLEFEALLTECDHIIICCNLTEKSRGMFNKKAFSLMKSNAILINISRGEVVDQDALIEALKTKRIRAAGIDVMYPEPLPKDHELMSLSNIVITPHIAAFDENTLAENANFAAKNIIEVLEGRAALTPVF